MLYFLHFFAFFLAYSKFLQRILQTFSNIYCGFVREI